MIVDMYSASNKLTFKISGHGMHESLLLTAGIITFATVGFIVVFLVWRRNRRIRMQKMVRDLISLLNFVPCAWAMYYSSFTADLCLPLATHVFQHCFYFVYETSNHHLSLYYLIHELF